MKNKKEFRLTLSSHAVEILEGLPQVSDFVFMGGKIGKPLSDGGMRSVLKRMGRHDITVHGFRTSFRTYIDEETSLSGRVAELAISHELTSETEKAYARGDLLAKRFEMMEIWGDYVCSG